MKSQTLFKIASIWFFLTGIVLTVAICLEGIYS